MKAEDLKRKDAMGRLHNRLTVLIDKSELTTSEVCLVLDNLKQSIVKAFMKEIGQD